MTFKLPRLSATFAIVDGQTWRATSVFSKFWDAAMAKIEGQFLVSGSGIVVSDGSQTAKVRSLVAGTGLNVTNGDGQSGNPSYALADTAVVPGTYGDATHVARPTVDQQGRITACANVAIAFPVTSVFGRTGAVVAQTGDYSASQISGLAAVATSGSASDLTTGTLPNGRLSSVPNSALANSSVTIAGHSVSLGGSQTLATIDLSDVTAPTLWTPSDQSGASLSFSSVDCFYQKIGGMYYVYGTLTFPATSNGNSIVIGGIPAVPNQQHAQVPSPVGANIGAGLTPIAEPIPNSTTFKIVSLSNDNTGITNAQLTSSHVRVMLIYPAS
jgi:hypothetical protein